MKRLMALLLIAASCEKVTPAGEQGSTCSDSIDNDSDGLIDCQETACDFEPNCLCGNTFVDAGELCDDGNNLDGDGCSSDCSGLEVCGDNTLDAGEICDDGNTTSGDGCRADCNKIEVCGDNTIDAGE